MLDIGIYNSIVEFNWQSHVYLYEKNNKENSFTSIDVNSTSTVEHSLQFCIKIFRN